MGFELSFLVSFVTAGFVSFCVVSVCEKPLSIFIRRIIQNETSHTFTRYVRYATYLVGISHGVKVNPLSFELAAHILEHDFIHLDFIHHEFNYLGWLIFIQGGSMITLTAIASMYLALFILGLIAYSTIKAREKRQLE